ncbi:helix-turn-helix domain-containing protein [Caproiciproducens sp. NJN-50]|uniref:helix-turn-helix domain-containing protein n=1 Tax=Acutalibacteraceae TaxID=3082771 RepID=UPI000FFE1272|nr:MULTISPECIES: helix-turn-helix domain-containing protein [Acutalibacteraceae]QAT50423.1 helix-turn-helix domain-containing protein [Caproiciproducens sp. NJN-50]
MELSIGKNIQNKRKAMGLTQDQLATALGVSIAAVSKWETGGAYPDITLLAPAARLLGVTVDDLLGFEPQLSKDRAIEICDQCAKLFEASDYENAVSFGEKYIREYPNSPLLKLRMGNVFMMHIPCAGTEDAAANLLSRAETLMRDAAKSDDIQIREEAWHSLSALLMQQERYEDALKALDNIHSSEIEPDQIKVSIYYAMGNYEKSKQMAQYLLATHAFGCNIALGTLANIAKKNQDYPLALRMENLSLQLSKMFDRDKIYGQDLNHYLMIAQCHAEQKQERETLDALHEFINCARMPADLDAVKVSPFYDSIEMHESAQSKGYLNRCVRQMIAKNPAFDFLKEDQEFADILKELGQLPE